METKQEALDRANRAELRLALATRVAEEAMRLLGEEVPDGLAKLARRMDELDGRSARGADDGPAGGADSCSATG